MATLSAMLLLQGLWLSANRVSETDCIKRCCGQIIEFFEIKNASGVLRTGV